MDVRMLKTDEERLAGELILADAFMRPVDEQELRRQAGSPASEGDALFGLFDDAGTLVAATATCWHRLAFGGHAVGAGEFHLVGSPVESRGRGNVRTLMHEVLAAFRERGDLFAFLIPFSFPFYRQFGFESCARTLSQRVATDELSCFTCDMHATRVLTAGHLSRVRALWEAFARTRSLAELYGDDHWELTARGEWSERDFLHPDCVRYGYLLTDERGVDRAYVYAMLVTAPENPFVGELHVTEVAYDDLESLGAVLGFCHRLRAKASTLVVELPDDIDLATIVANPDAVTRTVSGRVMARVLDVRRALQYMGYPEGEGSFAIAVEDPFLEGCGGTFFVRWREGEATAVDPFEGTPDLWVTIETLTQLVSGAATLDEACLRPGTRLVANGDNLRRVFCRRPVCLTLS